LRRATIAVVAMLVVALLPAAPSAADPTDDSRALRTAVTFTKMRQHLAALQRVADENGATRASGTPGYDASAAYVEGKLRAAGLQVTRQEFPFVFYRENTPSVVAQVSPVAKQYRSFTADYSPSGSVTGRVVPTNDIVIPPTSTPSSTSGCEAADFAPAGAEPQIALVQRGTCGYAAKVANAAAAGYDAIIIFNEGQPGRQDAVGGTLFDEGAIPATLVSFADGAELYAAARAGAVTGRVTTDTEIRATTTTNIVAETPTGRADEVLILGAHLDSVARGPGINDNGSGTAALLEIAIQYRALKIASRQKIRFAFWAAEEAGGVGSQYYVDNLSSSARAAVTGYLNFDMVGSPNYVRFLYDGDNADEPGPPGSGAIEQALSEHFTQVGLPVERVPFEFRSDYSAFFDIGIPVGGVHSGFDGIKTAEQAEVYGGTAGVAYDPNYHQPGDTLGNVNLNVLDQLADAAAHATVTLAAGPPVTRSAAPATPRADATRHAHDSGM
jgi:Zn-dependent M28 family amino/carboxypeptidase